MSPRSVSSLRTLAVFLAAGASLAASGVAPSIPSAEAAKPSYSTHRLDATRNATVTLRVRFRKGASVALLRSTRGELRLDLRRGRALVLTGRGGRVLAKRSVKPRRWHTVRVDVEPSAGVVSLTLDRAVGRASALGGPAFEPHRLSLLRAAATTGVTVQRGRVVLSPLRPTPSRSPVPAAAPHAPVPPRPAQPVSSAAVASPMPVASPAPVDQGTARGLPRPFSPTSFWNSPLRNTEALASNSSAMVSELVRQVNRFGPYLNTTRFSSPVYTVDSNTPRRKVTLDTYGPDLQQQWDAVPIPDGARPAAGTDMHMVIWDPEADKMWEFWKMELRVDGWHARWGGAMSNVSRSPGYFTHKGKTTSWGATATGLPLMGGLVSKRDLERGYIDHALALAIVEGESRWWSWPAQRTDGGSFTAGITPIAEGTRFRLDPNLDIASLRLPKLSRMLAEAAQKYGIVVRDQAGAVVFFGEDPLSVGSNPWPGVLGGQYTDKVVRTFPWDRLQAVAQDRKCCWKP